MEMINLPVVTIADGTGSVDRPLIAGKAYRLYAVEWIDGTFDDGVDAVLSCVSPLSGVSRTLLTLTDANDDAIHYPRALASDLAGAALDTAGDELRELPIVDGTLRLAVTSGGNVKAGGAIAYLC